MKYNCSNKYYNDGAPTAPSALLSCSSSPSSLSPEAHPLVSSGRSKAQRWEDSSPTVACAKESSPPRPSYRDVLAPRPATAARVLKSQSATAARVLNSQSVARVSPAAPPPSPCSSLGAQLLLDVLPSPAAGPWLSGDALTAIAALPYPVAIPIELSRMTYEGSASIAPPPGIAPSSYTFLPLLEARPSFLCVPVQARSIEAAKAVGLVVAPSPS
jgi:hypothetical protein